MDDTQPYRAKVRDRCVHSNFSYLHRSITVNLMMFLLTIYQTYSKVMKFVADHDQPQRLLERWAAPKKLVVATHYFWTAGTALQKSHRGLFQTLLYDIFRMCPEQIPECVLSDGQRLVPGTLLIPRNGPSKNFSKASENLDDVLLCLLSTACSSTALTSLMGIILKCVIFSKSYRCVRILRSVSLVDR